jgi:multiple sugar transport system permease protein
MENLFFRVAKRLESRKYLLLKGRTMIIIKRKPKPLHDKLFAYKLLLPVAIYLLLVMMMPFLWAFYVSVTRNTGEAVTFIGLEKYIEVLADPGFYNAVINTLVFTFFAVLGKVILGTLMALVLNNPIKLRNMSRSLLIIPWALPTVISILTWKWLFSDVGGVLSYMFKLFGFTQNNIQWLASGKIALASVIAVNIWRGTPFIAISVLAGLQTVSADLCEAATIDGANAVQRLYHIIIPHIKNVVGIASFVTTIWTINDFEIVWLLTRGGPAFRTDIISTYSYRVGFLNMDIAKATAVAIIFIPIMLILMHIVTKFVLPNNKSEG